MKFRKLFISFFFSICFLLGCGEVTDENQSGVQTLKMRSTHSVEDVTLKNVRLIRLSSNPFAAIGNIYKILASEDRIYVVDKMIGNSVFIFDKKGNYLNHIYRVGEGPGEYKDLDNLYFDQNKNLLILIPIEFGRKIYFDLDGNFIREDRTKHTLYYSDLLLFNDLEIVINDSYMNGESNFLVYKNGKLAKVGLPYIPHLDDIALNRRNLISKIDDISFSFAVGNRDTIFRYNSRTNEISPDYIFDLENPISKIDFGNHPKPFEYSRNNDMYLGIMDLFQNEDFLSLTTTNEVLLGRILSKSSNKLYDTGELIKNEIGDLGFDGILGLGQNGEFIAVLKAGEDGNWDFSENPELNAQFEKMGQVDSEEFLLLFFDLEMK